MFSAQGFKQLAVLQEVVRMQSLKHRVQEWVRQTIVDDDPYDDEELLDWGNRG